MLLLFHTILSRLQVINLDSKLNSFNLSGISMTNTRNYLATNIETIFAGKSILKKLKT